MIPTSNMHNFFDELPAEVKGAIDAVSTFRNVPEGKVIIRAGDTVDRLYQVVSGQVKASWYNREGRETVITFMRAGSWTGLSEMFSRLDAILNVVALAPVRLRAVTRQDLEVLMNRHPEIARGILRVVSLRTRLMLHLIDDRNLSLKERVVKTLYAQAFSHGKFGGELSRILISLSQEELSKLLVSSRQQLNRTLKELECEGLLELGYGGIYVRDLESLRQRYGHLIDVDEPAAVFED